MTDVLRLLVVEDDPLQLELIQRFLGGDGFEIVASAGPAEVRAEVTSFDPHVILLDLHMPGLSKDGLPDFIASLAPLSRANARVILFSASDASTLKRLATTTGAHGFVSKSDSLAELGNKLRAFRRAAEGA